MIDWDAMPMEKTPEEKRYHELCDQYYEMFGESFGVVYGQYQPYTYAELIANVEECIKTGKKQQLRNVNNDPGVVY